MILVLTDQEAEHLKFVVGADLEIVSNAIATGDSDNWEIDKALSQVILVKLNGGMEG